MIEEYFDVLDEYGNKIGKTKLRKEVHRDGDWHRGVHIWILNEQKGVLLQRRSINKDSHPGMLDISCAGHLSAGDDSITAARRELKEELGLDVDDKDLVFVKTFQYSSRPAKDFINNEFDDVYVLRTDENIDDMVLQEEEVSEVMYVSYDEFRKMVKEGRADLVKHGEEFELLLTMLAENAGN